MVIKKDSQLFIVLDVKPSLVGVKVIALLVITFGFLDHTKVNILGSRLYCTHQEVSTDSSSSSNLSLHNKFTFVSVLIASPDVGILWHSEFLYHNHYFLLSDLYISI